jgi:signal peptidase II
MLVLACVVVVDQLSKRLIDSSISPGEEQRFLPGVQLVHSLNHGVAFSFSAGGDSVVVVVIAVAVVAIVGYFATHALRPLLWLPTGLMVGGALGNLFDRIRDGAVTDFIKIPLWPAFNLADVSITVGVLALIYLMQDPPATADADPGTS